jgi:hypothetical protein
MGAGCRTDHQDRHHDPDSGCTQFDGENEIIDRWAIVRKKNIWHVSFLDFDLSYFDEAEGRVELGPNPFVGNVLAMPSV